MASGSGSGLSSGRYGVVCSGGKLGVGVWCNVGGVVWLGGGGMGMGSLCVSWWLSVGGSCWGMSAGFTRSHDVV